MFERRGTIALLARQQRKAAPTVEKFGVSLDDIEKTRLGFVETAEFAKLRRHILPRPKVCRIDRRRLAKMLERRGTIALLARHQRQAAPTVEKFGVLLDQVAKSLLGLVETAEFAKLRRHIMPRPKVCRIDRRRPAKMLQRRSAIAPAARQQGQAAPAVVKSGIFFHDVAKCRLGFLEAPKFQKLRRNFVPRPEVCGLNRRRPQKMLQGFGPVAAPARRLASFLFLRKTGRGFSQLAFALSKGHTIT